MHADLKNASLTLQQSSRSKDAMKEEGVEVTTVKDEADLIVGCDGSFSGIRKQLMRLNRMDYSQVQSVFPEKRTLLLSCEKHQ